MGEVVDGRFAEFKLAENGFGGKTAMEEADRQLWVLDGDACPVISMTSS
jgi:hypothetical protein